MLKNQQAVFCNALDFHYICIQPKNVKMDNRIAVTGILCLGMGGICTAYAQQTKPNVVFILADDLGYGDLGCYGQEKFATPNIDRLAQEGMRFTQCYSGTTVSAPSRSCLLTGMHSGHTYIRGNI